MSAMPDITQPEGVKPVERRLDGRGQGQAGGKHAPTDQPPKKVAETYEEAARAKPNDDRITILGIPVGQITPATQAALAGLVSEINYLRNVVKRLERTADRRAPAASNTDNAILEPEAFLRALGAALAQTPAENTAWFILLVHVATYEDIRRSSGLLAANATLADVGQRLREMRFDAAGVPVPFSLLGLAGGSNIAGVAALAGDTDPEAVARAVREHLNVEGYRVAGLDMALAIRTAAAMVGAGESGLLALGRADHILRTS